ncbi:hypothetical protein IHE45_20G006300 [Dioscorea alata]|uniref:Uncharacterized protein n=1 Tax=Dioscorea alata TaxID=55571 RepID=A0ACB7TQA4_DIOAL|nr:hypothetical protein IHE45_20G006300 [Dioscorea alata]
MEYWNSLFGAWLSKGGLHVTTQKYAFSINCYFYFDLFQQVRLKLWIVEISFGQNFLNCEISIFNLGVLCAWCLVFLRGISCTRTKISSDVSHFVIFIYCES